MVTEVRTVRNNNTVWIVLAILAGVAILAFAIMAANGRNDVTAPLPVEPPTATVSNVGNAMADGAADAARAARDAAAQAADSAGQAARSAADATIADPRPREPGVTATLPGPGDSTVTVTTPAR